MCLLPITSLPLPYRVLYSQQPGSEYPTVDNRCIFLEIQSLHFFKEFDKKNKKNEVPLSRSNQPRQERSDIVTRLSPGLNLTKEPLKFTKCHIEPMMFYPDERLC